MTNNTDLGKTSTGMQANIEAALCYLAGWITGLIFYLIEKENKFVRFHAFQSIVTFGAVTVLMIVLGIAGLWQLMNVLNVAQVVLGVVLMVAAFQGKKIKLPGAGDMAEKNS